MGRILNLRHDGSDNYIDLGNIKYINTFDEGTCVNIYLLKGFEYIVNPILDKYELLEPYIQFSFSSDRKKLAFAKTIFEEWEKYLEGKGIDQQ